MDAQRIPEQDGSLDATDEERLEGLLAQVRADVAAGHEFSGRDELRERIDEMGMSITDEEFEALAARLER